MNPLKISFDIAKLTVDSIQGSGLVAVLLLGLGGPDGDPRKRTSEALGFQEITKVGQVNLDFQTSPSGASLHAREEGGAKVANPLVASVTARPRLAMDK